MLLLAVPALATTLSKVSSETVDEGVTLTQYRASSPSTDVYVLSVDLCTADVYVDATRETDDYQTTGSWASGIDATAATNGDFYKTSPTRVYGDAYGGGVRWPSGNTGWDSSYSSEWYYEHYGWIAFLHDGVEFSHTGWVKENVSGLAYGIENDDLTPAPPKGVLAMVSGFPELVIEGAVVECTSPTDSSCFPDRSDMRTRNPRTAMGITEDLGTFLLVVADGRTSSNAGLYGSELAEIMGDLGAWEAFNLDGGGSSQMWTDASGYVNAYSDNNYGSGARTVANHWGIFAGGRDFLPSRPGHCATAEPCGTIPAAGGVIDDEDACWRGFGDPDYWRTASSGYDGSLRWTNAFESDRPDNWAWWRLEMEDAGEYEVYVYTNKTYSVFDDVEYEVRAGGASDTLRVDPTGATGWLSLGTYTFDEGGDQWVAVFDDQSTSPGSNQHIVADAVKLVRVGDWCGDGVCATDELCVCDDCPVTAEVAANGLDDDCDGLVDEDADADGVTLDAGDCDDGDATVYPGAVDAWYDGIDSNCDGADDFDADADGLDVDVDCDDADPAVGDPGTWYPDEDGDGFGGSVAVVACDAPPGATAEGLDCDDGDPARFPGNAEWCDGRPNDCGGSWDATAEDGLVSHLAPDGTFTDWTAAFSAGTPDVPAALALPGDGTLGLCGGTWYVELVAEDAGEAVVVAVSGSPALSGGGVATPLRVGASDAHVSVVGVALEDGRSVTTGGCVEVAAGSLMLDEVDVAGCAALRGGGVHVGGGMLAMNGGSVRASEATLDGGALAVDALAGPVSVVDTLFAGNTAGATGGAIHAARAVSVVGSVLRGNTAANGGALAYAGLTGPLALVSTLVTGNTATSAGGGLYVANAGTVTCTGPAASTVGFLANTAGTTGGAVFLRTTLGVVRSKGCDWGAAPAVANHPHDLQVTTNVYDKGDDASFVCRLGACD